MITAIVQRVEKMLKESGRDDVEVEIVFPVSPDAISTDAQGTSSAVPLTLPNGLTIIPGAASGACSVLSCCSSASSTLHVLVPSEHLAVPACSFPELGDNHAPGSAIFVLSIVHITPGRRRLFQRGWLRVVPVHENEYAGRIEKGGGSQQVCGRSGSAGGFQATCVCGDCGGPVHGTGRL